MGGLKYEKMSCEQKKAYTDYKQSSRKINFCLKNGRVVSLCTDLDNLISMSYLDKDIVLYCAAANEDVMSCINDNIYFYLAYASCTKSKTELIQFYKLYDDVGILVIECKRGSHILDMDLNETYNPEGEYLLPRRLKLRVEKIESLKPPFSVYFDGEGRECDNEKESVTIYYLESYQS